jgi:hypothetical protein
MLRTTTLLLAGALIAGCESDGVHGREDYHGNVQGEATYRDNVSGDQAYSSGRVSGAKSYGTTTADRTTTVDRSTPVERTTTVERTTPEPVVQPAAARTEVTARTERVTPTPTPTPTPAVTPARTEVANNAFPTGMKASNELTATTLIDRTGNSLRIANASDKDVRDAKVWIDGTYFARVSSIPSKATVTVDRTSFVNGSGNSPASLKDVKTVQLQTSSSLYNLSGPVLDDR